MAKYERKLQAANAAEDWDRVDRYAGFVERDSTMLEEIDGGPGYGLTPPAVPESMAAGYTWESTIDWTDEQLSTAYVERIESGDEAAADVLEQLMNQRDQLDRNRDAAIATMLQERQDQERAAFDSWTTQTGNGDLSPLSNPSRRPERRRSPDQVCREEYDTYVSMSYLSAEQDCRGHLLSAEGQARGVDPQTLFSGPARIAEKYASDELKSWWGRNGRVTYIEWKYQWFGRESDRVAARSAKHASYGEYVA
ncbi:hypothetical protein D5S17_28910 [Pseudonocardiaceae bacterium YIM PH 21723]|nr:hypothetical protein D5S17_28910 [Pseudonocardiaceae bacterium YIM PH 21723]